MTHYKKTLLALGLLLSTSSIFAADTFVVRHISFHGLRKLNEASALHYLPFHAGEQFTSQKSAQIITALYKTGFFSDVEIFRQQNDLIIQVEERPTIASLDFSGNKTITDEKLNPILKKLNLAVGGFYDPSVLNELQQGLQTQYNNMGYYAIQIKVIAKRLPRNRVAITVQVTEGKLAKVSHINFTGNHAFSTRTLRDQMALKRTGLFSWFTKDNRYSEYALDLDVGKLQTFYMNHGYLEFQVVGRDVTENPRTHATDIVLHLMEGPQYHVSGFEVAAPYGDDPGIKKIMSRLHAGEIFSRQELLDFQDAISHYYANKGFAFAKVQMLPRVDQKNHTVFLTYTLVKGDRISVRRISFVGNDHTLDSVLRTRLVQMEGAPYSLSKVKESKQELQMLSYVKDVSVDTKPVPTDPDAVDLDYHLKEFNAGRASVNGGWSDMEGFMYGANVVEPNFLGTGRSTSIGFTRSQLQANYSIAYTDPFYTVSGISRSINVYYNQTYPTKTLGLEPYTMNDFGGSVSYGIPIALHDLISVGYGYDYISISNVQGVYPLGSGIAPAAPSVLQFLARNKSPFSQFNLLAGWSHVTLNRAIFPTSGNTQSLNGTVGVPVIDRSVAYYKLTYSGKWYFPLTHGLIFEPHTDLGYGGGFGRGINSTLPFYNNFFAGGIDTVPGFAPNSLGPFNTNNPLGCVYTQGGAANCNRVGGNVLALAGLNLIFPNPFGERFRTALFIDAGNVFDTYKAQYTPAQRLINPALLPIPYENIAFSNLRVSAGVMLSWWSPMGPIEISFGFPLNKKKSDDPNIFGFTFGASI